MITFFTENNYQYLGPFIKDGSTKSRKPDSLPHLSEKISEMTQPSLVRANTP